MTGEALIISQISAALRIDAECCPNNTWIWTTIRRQDLQKSRLITTEVVFSSSSLLTWYSLRPTSNRNEGICSLIGWKKRDQCHLQTPNLFQRINFQLDPYWFFPNYLSNACISLCSKISQNMSPLLFLQHALFSSEVNIWPSTVKICLKNGTRWYSHNRKISTRLLYWTFRLSTIFEPITFSRKEDLEYSKTFKVNFDGVAVKSGWVS